MSNTAPKLPLLEDLFPEYVSVFANAFSKEPEHTPELGGVLDAIKSGEWQSDIERVRRYLDRNELKKYDDAKRNLKAFTMSAYMMTRDQSVPVTQRITRHSGYLQGDFDGKENGHLEDPAQMRDLLIKDPHVGFAFISPSGRGVKIGIRIDPERHRESFQSAEAYFLKRYGLQMDRSTKDPTRLCFVSWDPDLRVQPEPKELPIDIPQTSTRAEVYHPPVETTAADVAEMLSYIPRRPAYDDWLRISSAVFSALPMEQAMGVLNTWSPEEKPGEYADKHRAMLKEVTIGTLVWYAQQHGFDARAANQKKQWAARIRFASPTKIHANREDFTVDPNAQAKPRVISDEFILKCYQKGQLGDAELYAAIVGNTVLYDHFAKVWRIYKRGIWERDDMNQTKLDINEQVSRGYRRLIELTREDMKARPQPKPEGPGRPKNDARQEEIDAIRARIGKLNQKGYLEGVSGFCESVLATLATGFDKRGGLLVLENGTIDFDEGVFREHRASDMITHRLSTHYDPQADCPKWMEFLRFFMDGDGDKIAYLARAVGYSLTGFVDKDALFFCYGKGANGKSTFTSALKLLSGNYMTTVSIEALLTKASDNNYDYKKAEMEGKRIVVTDEIPENKTLNESAVKSLVGGDEITARRPFERPYSFEPTHKLWLVGNHKPTVRGTDHGIWRRIHLIPWLVTMPEEQRRPRHEVLAEFREELPGILNWAINGYLDMIDIGGLKPPASIKAATDEYQTESDQIKQFMDERMESDLYTQTQVSDAYNAYRAWCVDVGESQRYIGHRAFIRYFKDHGINVREGHGRKKIIDGFQLLTPE